MTAPTLGFRALKSRRVSHYLSRSKLTSFTLRQAHEAMFAALAKESTGVKLQACPSGYSTTITIPVYFHIVYWYGEPIDNPNYGYVPASDLKVVVANLNKQFAAFKPRFKFVYKSTTYKKYLDYHDWTTESSIRLPL